MQDIKFTTKEIENIYKGKILDLDVCTIELSDGKILKREVVKHSGAVVIVPVLDNGDIILINQFRYPTNGFIWEFPAGTLDKNENPADCARRELREEIGYEAGSIKELLSFYTTPGFSTEYMYLFLASNLTETERQLEEDECLESKIFPRREIEAMIKKKEIVDSKTILSFLYYSYVYLKN